MEDLLFLAHRLPYPPNKGDKIRSWNILRYLAGRYRVHLACFVDDPEDWRYQDELRAVCGECCLVPLRPRIARLASLRCLPAGEPLTLGYYRSREMSDRVSGIADRHDIRRVFVFSSSMAQYVLDGRLSDARLVVDFVDVDSDKWAQYADRKPWPWSWLYRREARTLGAYERTVAAAASASLLVSEAEADLFRTRAPEAAARVHALHNGVDFDFFDPGMDYDDPFSGAPGTLVFTGQMDYWANVDAVGWFAREILPRIRGQISDATFWIVGARPTSEVRKLADLPGVRVTGSVPDVRPYIAHAAAVVAPLRVARGVQNKVLEAMAMAKTVVATPEAADGINAQPGRDLIVAAGVEEFAAQVASVLGQEGPDGFGRRARDLVVADYGWSSNLADLNAILEGSRV